jgi:polyhydroxyalkanoate synthesis regulator phasin
MSDITKQYSQPVPKITAPAKSEFDTTADPTIQRLINRANSLTEAMERQSRQIQQLEGEIAVLRSQLKRR